MEQNRDLYEGPMVTVNYGQMTPDDWNPEIGQDEPLIIKRHGDWSVVNIRQLAYYAADAQEDSETDGTTDLIPEVTYYAQYTTLVRARVTVDPIEIMNTYPGQHYRITVWGLMDTVIAQGTYRVEV